MRGGRCVLVFSLPVDVHDVLVCLGRVVRHGLQCSGGVVREDGGDRSCCRYAIESVSVQVPLLKLESGEIVPGNILKLEY